MTSDRIQRQMDRLLDEADRAFAARDWPALKDAANDVLSLDAENKEAKTFLAAAEKNLASLIAETAPGAGSSAAPSSRATNQPTSFANGRYAVKRFLGEGGRKKVYLAHDTLLDRDVAFALIKTEGLDEVGKERVTREAQAMGRLGEHPNNVSVYDIGDESGQPYVVLPLMPGGDVEGEIENAPEHKLPLERVLQIAIDTCQGLAFAHERGILHRDIKPGNVWLATDGRAQVGDWGLAVASDRTRLTQAGMMVGTPTYMPPEQAMGGEITTRSDLYSLGAMLYEMVCGRPPFVGDESVAIIGQHLNTPPVAPTWHRPDCPPALEALILRLLEKDPNKRPESASVVREALQAIGQSGNLATVGAQFIAPDGGAAGTNPQPLNPRPPLQKDLRRARARAAAAAGGLRQCHFRSGRACNGGGRTGHRQDGAVRAAHDLRRHARRQGACRPLLRGRLAKSALPALRRSHARICPAARAGRPQVRPGHRRRRCGPHRLGGTRPT